MKKWKATIPGIDGRGTRSFEFETNGDPRHHMVTLGYELFNLEEITPPVVPVVDVETNGRLTLSVQEAAEELGVCTKTVYTLVHRADFPTLRIGSRVRVSRAGLAEWVRKHTQDSVSI